MRRLLLVLCLVLTATGPVSAHGRPSNDDFAAAQPLGFGDLIDEQIDTHDATNEADENRPPPGPVLRSVWYRVTSEKAATLRVYVGAEEGVPPNAAAWAGDSLADLRWIGGGESFRNQVWITLALEAGETVSVQVGTENEEGGMLRVYIGALRDGRDPAVQGMSVERQTGATGPLSEGAQIGFSVANIGWSAVSIDVDLQYCAPGSSTCYQMMSWWSQRLDEGQRLDYSYTWENPRWIGDVDVRAVIRTVGDVDPSNNVRVVRTWFVAEGTGLGMPRPLV